MPSPSSLVPVLFYPCFMRSLLIAVALCLATSPLSAQSVTLTPDRLSPGSPVLISIDLSNATSIDGTLLNLPLHFFHPASKPNIWIALAGIDVETPVEPASLSITAHLSDGTTRDLSRSITLTPANYRTTTISVATKYVKPSPKDEKVIEEEQALKTKLFEAANAAAAKETTPLWQSNFRVPVKSQPTDSFGTRRVVKSTTDQKVTSNSVHKGMDFRAPSGTLVRAANSGTVLLAQHLFMEGNCVILDHGLNLYTLYMHFSRIDVKPGQQIHTGEPLGLSGATGRVTGPHLHWAVRYQNVYLDPAKLLELTLPTPAASAQ
jgi:murein DD-endopeptidase MepM/ murein hydrolase activator NlpD